MKDSTWHLVPTLKRVSALIRTLERCWGSSVILPGQTCPILGTVLHLSFSWPAHSCCMGQSHFPNRSPRKFGMSPSRKPLSTLQCLKTNLKKKNLSIWLCQFSVLAHGIFTASCGIFHLRCRLLSICGMQTQQLPHAGLGSHNTWNLSSLKVK